jgi:hypothetical protein
LAYSRRKLRFLAATVQQLSFWKVPALKRVLAPIAILVYRRTATLTQAFDALESCPEFADSPVFVYSDGPKDSGTVKDVAAVRGIVRDRLRPNMRLIERPKNIGLAASTVAGVTQLCEEFGRVIVVEDDLIVSPGALAWFNSGLDRFAGDLTVWQVNAYQWNVPEFANRKKGLFLNFTNSWGWATWKRAWDRFDLTAAGWAEVRDKLDVRAKFDLGGIFPYSDMLERAIAGSIDSWAVRFWWSVFRAGGISLFPPPFDDCKCRFRLGRHELSSRILPPPAQTERPADLGWRAASSP